MSVFRVSQNEPETQYVTPFIGYSEPFFDDKEKARRLDELITDLFRRYIPDWTFAWDSHRRRYGICRYRSKHISVSLHRARVTSFECTERTILHEVAHAVTPGHKHDDVWRRMAQELGIENPTTYVMKGDVLCVELTKKQ